MHRLADRKELGVRQVTGGFEAMAQFAEDTGECLAFSEDSTIVCRARTGSGLDRVGTWEGEALVAGWLRSYGRMCLRRHCRVVTYVR